MRRVIPFLLMVLGTVLSLTLLVVLHPAFGIRQKLGDLRHGERVEPELGSHEEG